MSQDDDHEATRKYFRRERKDIAHLYRGLSPAKQREFLDTASDEEKERLRQSLRENPE